ncbi:hypothetical protein P3T27_006621 [Kitasatospora sp. MAA19]|uniref:hypothetical protein n=1 Tax=Kitasatospora sp. MAA19 TaxID=3035090 RepID=UPI002474346F|nr:hypothetical protein [Kitasatospora sp. MAA19]MDH6709872.1 hypothetical protein [Kitasatospora sp. MAA19]
MTEPFRIDLTNPAPTGLGPALPIGTYVLYRDVDRYLAGHSDHTRACRVIDHPADHLTAGCSSLLDLRTQETIPGVPVTYLRVLAPAEIMHDIDTAPLTTLDDGRTMTAAGAWLAANHPNHAA